MILGIIRRISKDDLVKVGDVPKWIDALLQPLNDFIEKVGLAMQNRLTFKDNVLGKVVSLKFTHNVQTEVNPYPSTRGTLSVAGVVPVTTGDVFIVGFKWVRLSNGNIGVTFKLDGATTATIKLQIHLE